MRTEMDRVCEKYRVSAKAELTDKRPPGGFASGTRSWRVQLTRRPGSGARPRTLTVDFFTGSAIECEPTAADVIACLVSDACAGRQSFEDFCADFGYDTDSRKAEATWKGCKSMSHKLARFLGATQSAFESAEHWTL